MELTELGDEYLRRCDVLLCRIKDLKQQIGALTVDEKICVKRRIAMLYDDVEYCRQCAYILINYRKGDEQYDIKKQI